MADLQLLSSRSVRLRSEVEDRRRMDEIVRGSVWARRSTEVSAAFIPPTIASCPLLVRFDTKWTMHVSLEQLSISAVEEYD